MKKKSLHSLAKLHIYFINKSTQDATQIQVIFTEEKKSRILGDQLVSKIINNGLVFIAIIQ